MGVYLSQPFYIYIIKNIKICLYLEKISLFKFCYYISQYLRPKLAVLSVAWDSLIQSLQSKEMSL